MTQTISQAAPVAAPVPQQPPPIPRIPPVHAGLQYNACKNPKCPQFGMPAEDIPLRSPPGAYSILSGGKGYPLLKCNACGETPPLKSNLGIAQEVERLGNYLMPKVVFCPNDATDPTTGEPVCRNHADKVPYGTRKAYQAYGANAQGSKRAKCKCGKVFIVSGKAAKGQHETFRNRDIFSMLVNGVVLSRIVKMLDISWEVLYHRIDFIHAQCMAFVAHRERRLLDMPVSRLYLSIDAQDYFVNWSERKDKRNVVLKAITAVDSTTGYVFCNALNFDETADPVAVEADVLAIGDAALPPARRKHARFWLAADYMDSVMDSAKRANPLPAHTLLGKVSSGYAAATARDNVETFDEKKCVEKLPDRGMQIHSEYTMIAMFHHLKAMVGNVGAWRFFLDQESGIRAACLSAFADEIKARTAEAFYVKIEKGLIQEEKVKRVAEAEERFKLVKKANPKLSDDKVRLLMIKAEIANQRKIGMFKDSWVSMPEPSMSEPEKAVCWLTAHDDFKNPDGTPDADHVAWLYNKATLHAVDSFFMKTRRSIVMCERPIHSSGNAGRVWSGKQAYDPAILKKVLEIFRVHHNFTDLPLKVKGVKKGERETPAMRLGLADAPLDFRDILYYTR